MSARPSQLRHRASDGTPDFSSSSFLTNASRPIRKVHPSRSRRRRGRRAGGRHRPLKTHRPHRASPGDFRIDDFGARSRRRVSPAGDSAPPLSRATCANPPGPRKGPILRRAYHRKASYISSHGRIPQTRRRHLARLVRTDFCRTAQHAHRGASLIVHPLLGARPDPRSVRVGPRSTARGTRVVPSKRAQGFPDRTSPESSPLLKVCANPGHHPSRARQGGVGGGLVTVSILEVLCGSPKHCAMRVLKHLTLH